MASHYVIAGLGNPGSKYSETRHNAGFWFLDELARANGLSFRGQSKLHAELARGRVGDHECILFKPTTFMNESGRAVRSVLDYFDLDTNRLLVAYDELDLEPGITRLKRGGGHGGHNGMRDIFRHVSDTDFLRLRIGIGHPGHRDAVTPWVLGRPTRAQELAIRHSLADAIKSIPLWMNGDLPAAMKQLHTEKSNGL